MRAYFVAFLVGDAAAQIQSVAVAWSVYQIAHRPFDLGLVGLTLFVPSLFLVLVTGSVADRFDRKLIVIAASAVEIAGSFGLAELAASHTFRLDTVLPIVFVLGVARAFGATAERTILINVVEEDRFVATSALYSSLREVVVLGGPALGGILVAFSVPGAFLGSALLLLVAIVAFAFVRLRKTTAPAANSWRSALQGFHFVRTQPLLLGAISLDLFAVLLGGATALLPVYAADILHVGAVGFGFLRSADAAGALVTGIYLHRHPPVRHIGRTLLISVFGFGLATLVFAFSRDVRLTVVALTALGACDMVSVVLRNGIVQLRTPDHMRGRVSAIEMVFIGASNELGAFESGTLAQLIGAVPAVAAGAMATLAIVGLWAIAFPALRRSDRLAPD